MVFRGFWPIFGSQPAGDTGTLACRFDAPVFLGWESPPIVVCFKGGDSKLFTGVPNFDNSTGLPKSTLSWFPSRKRKLCFSFLSGSGCEHFFRFD